MYFCYEEKLGFFLLDEAVVLSNSLSYEQAYSLGANSRGLFGDVNRKADGRPFTNEV